MRLDAPDVAMLMLVTIILMAVLWLCFTLSVITVSGSACAEAHYKQIKLETCGDKK